MAKDAHLLELARYLVLNPVRAGLTKSAGGWAWSSYRATAGIEKAPPWLETHATLESFNAAGSRAVQKFRTSVAEGRGCAYDPWEQVKGQIYLGGDIHARRLVADFLRRERLMPPRDIAALLGVKPWQASALARAGEVSDDPRGVALLEALKP